jgi:hypothetical protein
VYHHSGRAEQEIDQARVELEQAEEALVEAAPKTPWKDTLAGLPWKRIALVTAGVFVAAMIVIVTFELVAGRPLSTVTGGTSGDKTGTSIPGLGSTRTTPTEAPSTTPGPTSAPSDAVTPTVGGPAATTIPSRDPSAPETTAPTSAAPTPTPSATPTRQPTATAPAPTAVAPTTPVGRPGVTPVDPPATTPAD